MYPVTADLRATESSIQRDHGALADPFFKNLDRNSQSIGLVINKRPYTYSEMADTAGRWAARLVEFGSGSGRRIGVHAYRSPTAYIGILSAVLSGATFVPLNPKFPVARTRQMIEQAQLTAIIVDCESLQPLVAALEALPKRPRLILTNGSRAAAAHHLNPDFSISCDEDDLRRARSRLLNPNVSPTDIAYLLFTSGSTGAPKGVPISYNNLASFLAFNQQRYCFTPSDRFSQTFDQTFDLSVFDMFMAWGAGGSLYILQQHHLSAPLDFINANKLTVWFSVPSVASRMMRKNLLSGVNMPTLRWSLFCGEALPRSVAEAWQSAAPNSTLENLYGPTELTIACAVHRWDPTRSSSMCEHDTVPIGHIYDELAALVVGADLKPVSNGSVGELCVAGPQTFPGYWRSPALTADRVFEAMDALGNLRRYYRTGDLVRQLPSGEFICLGRLDSQIKLNGYRIDLGEVEAVLRQSGCFEAIAVSWPSPSKVEGITAYVTGSVSVEQIKAYARNRLPKYMIPKRIEVLDSIPLNVNGKADRALLHQWAIEGLCSPDCSVSAAQSPAVLRR